MQTRTIAIAYIPVLHRGYLAYLEKLEEDGVRELYLVGDELLASHEELDYLNRKDRIRALPEATMLALLRSAFPSLSIELLSIANVMALHEGTPRIRAPREDVNEFVMETYFDGHPISYDEVFLRWNKSNVEDATDADVERVSLDTFERDVFAKARGEATKSADWWRQVGAALIKDGKVLYVAHNEHLPEEEYPNAVGDARSLYKKGDHVNYVTSAHAEASVIGLAAKEGVSTDGATLITTDFPCPFCARVIVKSGIARIFYEKGYPVLGGHTFFKEMGIEVKKIET
ncbi:MAG TPA: deaminase [Candidatus Paceibacterota bacterium]|nr:deaminase [Candidatus Paceibacterota bacterium]